MTDELLLDKLYRQTFKKTPEPNPELRARLQSARRFVLDDAMSEFLMYMTFYAFRGKWKKIYHALDEARHFSRLPHATTWVEYPDEPMAKAFLEIKRKEKLNDSPHNIYSIEAAIEAAKGRRTGWLMIQHPKIETAFECTQFFNVHNKEYGEIVDFNHCALVWDTDDSPLPFRGIVKPKKELRGFKEASEYATAIHGYVRSNIGYISKFNNFDHLDTALDDIQNGLKLTGRLRYIWMFLSTVNKIPLLGETEMRTAHGFIGRNARQPFLTHKFLTLRIPDNQRRKLAKATATAVMRRRAHMVRGHWRDDWHQPKGNKSLWIAEHQRGDASLGFVLHDYEVIHQ